MSELFVPTTPARYRDTFLPIATSPTTAESIAESRPQPGSRQSPKDRCIPHPLPLRCLVQLTAAGLSFHYHTRSVLGCLRWQTSSRTSTRRTVITVLSTSNSRWLAPTRNLPRRHSNTRRPTTQSQKTSRNSARHTLPRPNHSTPALFRRRSNQCTRCYTKTSRTPWTSLTLALWPPPATRRSIPRPSKGKSRKSPPGSGTRHVQS